MKTLPRAVPPDAQPIDALPAGTVPAAGPGVAGSTPGGALWLAPEHLAALSYGLRGPLAAMLGCADLLTARLGSYGPEYAAEVRMVDSIRRSGVRQVRALDNLSALADLLVGAPPAVSGPVDLSIVLARLRVDLSVELAEAGVLLAILPSGRPPVVVGDAERLRHALGELVRNAIAASEPGKTVMVSAGAGSSTTGEAEVQVRVEDCGRGIPAEDLPHLTEPFTRTRCAGDQQVPGVGLGLAVADGVIRAHLGRLEITSLAGQGTRAVVRLPTAPTAS